MSLPQHTNRLIKEKSPHLLQHAHNPVDWYPWGEEAFEAARSAGKPIFLSIGYATCHWCHVMQEESFTNPQIAGLMNEAFINVKVDREELPEVDSIYMELAQALMASKAGWPLNVLLTPDLKPFVAVTYLPPFNRKGLVGLQQFVQQVKQLWEGEERERLLEQADKIIEIFARTSHAVGEELPSEKTAAHAVEFLLEAADPLYGGIRGEPKFPLGYQLLFLLEFSREKKDSRSLFFVELTLEMMRKGGIYDQLGGGFSRHAVDEKWQVPHFEKMLYDNALLADAYLETWKYTQKETFKEVAVEVLEYLLRDMAHPEGGFYSAEDADSEGREGLYYTWTPEEVQGAVPEKEAEIFCQCYGVTSEGNFHERSVLHETEILEEVIENKVISSEDLSLILQNARKALLRHREQRTRPFKDDKVLSSWNGLVIHVLAKAASAFEEKRFETAALQAAEFIKQKLWVHGRLMRRYREREAKFSGGVDEYAFMIKGVLTLFDEGHGAHWLQWALEMSGVLEAEFKAEGGAFYHTNGKESLVLRKCEYYDGAEPSGNAVHAENLLRLFAITQDERYLKQAEDILKAARPWMEKHPPGACYHLLALQRYLDEKRATVYVLLDERRSLKERIHKVLAHHFSPHVQVIWRYQEEELIETLVPALAGKKPVDGQTTVYLCRQKRCEPPMVDPVEILKVLGEV